MYGQLGDIVFKALYGFDSFNVKGEQVISEHARIEGKPRLQNSGSKADELSLSIRLHANFTDPEKQLAILKEYKEKGEVLTFLNGKGVVYGDFILKSYDYTPEVITPEGEMVSVYVNLSLIENYFSDRKAQEDQKAKSQGFANASNNPIQKMESRTMVSDQALLGDQMKKVNTDSAKVDEKLSMAQKVQQDANRYMNEANKTLDSVRSNVSGMRERLLSNLSLGQQAGQLLNQFSALLASIDSLKTPLTMHDLQAALGLNGLFQSQINTMNVNFSPIASSIAGKSVL